MTRDGWSCYGETIGQCIDEIRRVHRALDAGEPYMGVDALGKAWRLLGQTLFMSRWKASDWLDRIGDGTRVRVRRVLVRAQDRFEDAIRDFSIPACLLCSKLTSPNDRIPWRGGFVHAVCQMERSRKRSLRVVRP